ncbi:MAG: DMT family transporter [Bacteroidetes bacterium]|nr:DMT family transporter [Bacteroidota bacterium]
MNEKTKIVFLYIVVCFVWGSSWLAMKWNVQDVTPLLASGTRFALACVGLFIIIKRKKIEIPKDADSFKLFIIVSLTAFSVPFALNYFAAQFIPSGLSAILFAMYPFMVAILSYFMLDNEKINAYKIIGMISGFSGVYFLFAENISFENSNFMAIVGMGSILISAFAQAYSLLLVKTKGQNISPFVMSYQPMLYAAITTLLVSYFIEDYSKVNFTLKASVSILYLAVFGSIITFVSYWWLVKKVEAVLLSFTAFITPVVAIYLGITFANETVSKEIYFGTTLVLLGIILANLQDFIKLFTQKKLSD